MGISCSQVEFAEIPLVESPLLAEAETVLHSRSFEVASVPQIDVVFIVDNSGSMQEEQVELAKKISSFIQEINHLDWRLSVITTDLKVNSPVGLTNFGFNSFKLDKGDYSYYQAQAILAQLIGVGTGGSGNEVGIRSLVSQISADLSLAAPTFHRKDSTLVTILISDEDECSDGLCALVSGSSSNPVTALSTIKTLFQDKFGISKEFRFHSLIKVPGDSSCSTAHFEAKIYQQMSNLTNGLIGSICSSDYMPILKSIGADSVELVTRMDLSCSNPHVTLIHESSGTRLTNNFTVSDRTLIFETALLPGKYRIEEQCYSN